jgi:hypothetical protein
VHQDYKGTSIDNALFAGDFDLAVEIGKNLPPDCLTIDNLPAQARAAARGSANIFGLAGAVCLETPAVEAPSSVLHNPNQKRDKVGFAG